MDSSIKKSLYEAARRLNSVKFEYALIGSANLALQGIDIKPNDIDFFVKSEQFPKLEEAFFEYEFSPIPAIQNQGKIYLKKKILLDGVEVEFGTEPAEGWYGKYLKDWTVTLVELEDITVKCLPLENELLVYEALERFDKTKLIQEYLSNV